MRHLVLLQRFPCSKDPNVEKAHERTRRLVIETNTENVPDSSQTSSVHESETFNVGDKHFVKERGDPLLIMRI